MPLADARKVALTTGAARKAELESGVRAMAEELVLRDAALAQASVDMTASGRLAEPSDIADAVCFLASDRARAITGEVLTVSGGY